jgi:CO/xanthine dehydrogenase FAD-binding subunit
MNLNTIAEVRRPASADQITQWPDGYAWLADGTRLFSEPQIATDTLIDLHQLNWPALQPSSAGLDIAATCTVAELYRFAGPSEWQALPVVRECCNSFLASFKIWNAATVGGNICMSLPAGPMISLTVALEATYTLWPRIAPAREVPSINFVTGNHTNVLQQGELLRSIHVPASALSKRFAFRHASLTHLGRSAALLIGTQSAAGTIS